MYKIILKNMNWIIGGETSHQSDLYGIENQLGFITKPIVVNKGETYDWFLVTLKYSLINLMLITLIKEKIQRACH